MNKQSVQQEEELIYWVEDIKDKNGSSAAALYIIKDNQVVMEHYSGRHSHEENARHVQADSRFNVASARKSYLGLAAAYALYDRYIESLDDPITRYMTDLDSKLFKDTTIRHLLTHSHGLDVDEHGHCFREFRTGTSWAYRNIGVDIMTKLIANLYGKGFPQLLEERVFSKLGLEQTGWVTEKDENLVNIIGEVNEPPLSGLGTTNDGTEKNLFVSPCEFALWGLLHLQKGRIDGEQIVPAEVIERSTSIQNGRYADSSLPDNGFFWYVQGTPRMKSEIGDRVPRGSYQILGVTGPTLLIIPSLNVVVAKMYNKRYNYGGKDYLYFLREFSNKVSDLFSSGE
ncbi:serine hydrolase domain-containing protein [Rossellomorea sp. NPDC077527]|uniref:serine hydrolase domain-containing protein n=1 Tax=Rossellomorea sp. NPDC077527 TaxID=3364510 RepID=UPI0037C61097